MIVCAGCGEVELIYVLACGDAAVGKSKVLLYSGRELTALKAEVNEVDANFKQLTDAKSNGNPDRVIVAQEHLAVFLQSYIDPETSLPGKHLVQAYALHIKRWIYVRSDKLHEHWKSYDIDESLTKEKDIEGGKQLDRSALREAFQKASDDIKTDLAKGISYKGQIAKGEVEGSITDLWEASWLKWVDAVNDSLTYSRGGARHDLSAGAQLLRGYADFNLQLGHNPKDSSYGMTGSAGAKAVLAEASATFNGYLPAREGWHALMNYTSERGSEAGRERELNFGYFRGNLEIKTEGMLGASLMGTAGIKYTPLQDGTVLAQPDSAGTKGKVALEAFAGVEAGGSVTGSLEWQNPGLVIDEGAVQEAGWAAVVSVGLGIGISFGIGGEGELKIGVTGGRLTFRCKAQLVMGAGGSGDITGTIGFDTMFDFLKYVYNQLKDEDFSYLDFMDEDAFHVVVAFALAHIEGIGDVAIASAEALNALLTAASQPFSRARDARNYAIKIKQRPHALIFSPPEVKGAVLHKLSERYTFSFEEHQEAAILTVLGTVQTQREWSQIVERINPLGAKTSEAAGMMRLNRIMDGGSQRKMDTLIRAINSLPPATMLAGQPVRVRTLA